MQVGDIDGQPLDAVYGQGEPSAHLYFFFGKGLDGHAFSHYEVLAAPDTKLCRSISGCVELPCEAAWLISVYRYCVLTAKETIPISICMSVIWV